MGARRVLGWGLKTIYFLTLLSIFNWSMPFLYTPEMKASWPGKWRRTMGPVFRLVGLWQGWSMFAPNPSNYTLSIQVAVEFQNGTFEFVTLPLLHQMNDLDAISFERHRKFIDHLRLDDSKTLWPGVADHYYRKFLDRGPIKQIDMVRWWTTIKKPNLNLPPPPQPTYVNFENSYLFYSKNYL